jgi:metal-sulfur cluster biosynthetic enzyme
VTGAGAVASTGAVTGAEAGGTEERLAGWDAELVEALRDGVIDPDLGINVVDMGFIRAIRRDGDTLVLVMTLTSPACPLTKVIEDQAAAAVAGVFAAQLRIDWEWTPAWRPADITGAGRDQLTAIGFSF